MKQTLIILLVLISLHVFAQNKLMVINAGSSQATISEQDNPISNWHISPAANPDIFTTGKLTKTTTIKFRTDVDSISFRIKPGQHKDFVVLLNGKDSCRTRIQAPALKNFSKLPVEIHDSIPFFLNQYNTNFLKVVFNHADTLLLNFDTGATELSFTNGALQKNVKSHPTLYSTPYDIRIRHQNYQSKIYDIQLSGNETDGLLGWDLFDGMIVELDYDHHQLILHSKMPLHILHDRNYA